MSTMTVQRQEQAFKEASTHTSRLSLSGAPSQRPGTKSRPSARKPTRKLTLLDQVRDWAWLRAKRFEGWTCIGRGLYEPWEMVLVLSLLALSVLFLAYYLIFILPSYLSFVSRRLTYYISGRDPSSPTSHIFHVSVPLPSSLSSISFSYASVFGSSHAPAADAIAQPLKSLPGSTGVALSKTVAAVVSRASDAVRQMARDAAGAGRTEL